MIITTELNRPGRAFSAGLFLFAQARVHADEHLLAVDSYVVYHRPGKKITGKRF